MLKIDGLYANYGRVTVLRDVSLDVQPGEIVALLGANGAGKTTLLNVVSGLMSPSQGTVTFEGKDITGLPAESVVGRGISHVPERRQIFGSLSVMDNLCLGAYHRHRKESGKAIADDLEAVLALFPVLNERRGQRAGTLSGGEQQMLALGRGLMAAPRLLLLDEPSLGLAPLVVREIMRAIRELRERGTTLLLVEQNTKAALAIADRALVMETGCVVSSGSAGNLLDDAEVRAAYLGRRGASKYAVAALRREVKWS